MLGASNGHVRPYGIGDDALFVSQMMKSLLVGWHSQFLAAVGNPRIERD
jgi:hypothetical protein